MRDKYTEINSQTWDKWVSDGNEWTKPISHQQFVAAQNGDWQMLLTPCRPVPREWFGELRGKRVLGLASGGGQQMPVFAAQGAICTVFDNSAAQLATEREIAARERYQIEIIKGDMTQPLPFADNSFDLIFHPVSNCYIEDVYPLWRECYRVLAAGGALLAGMDNGLSFLVDEEDELHIVNKLPFNPLRDYDERQLADLLARDYGLQFSHTLEEQIGGQLKAGLRLTDVYEDYDNCGVLREYAPAFWATRAIKE
ncbi:MAG: class I SAM-dependent methyltransferase [Bacillota bacterium]|nr:class I SAM-dependent methyltransferase [Bacillota bacterium]